MERATIYDTDGDQTGMVVYVLPGQGGTPATTKLAAAWGQDPSTASAGAPGLDVGTGVPPVPLFEAGKDAILVTDADGDGFISPGDTIQYDVRISNVSRAPVSNLNLVDTLPPEVTYVAGTTQFKRTPSGSFAAVPDDGSGTPFPLDGSGYNIPAPALAVGGQFQIVFNVTIKNYANLGGVTKIINTGSVTDGNTTQPIRDEQPLYGSLGDRVWLDADNDGVQDAGESGISGVTVFLDTDNDGVQDVGEPTDVTDANGIYTFNGLIAGTYNVRVVPGTLPAGAAQTYDLDGLGTANVASVILGGGQDRTDVDFGYRGNLSIGDFVWNDVDADGVQDGGEAGIPSVRVYIDSDGDGSYDVGEPTSITNGSGTYTIGNLLPGTYTVRVDTTTLPAGYVQTYDLNGPLDNAATATLVASSLTTVDFGYRQLGSIGDRVWNDVDGDGLQDAGETGLNGVIVYIDSDGDGVRDAGEPNATTTGDGNYTIGNLPAGTYTVRVDTSTLPAGFVQTYDLNGGLDNAASVTLAAGQNRTDVDYGYKLAVPALSLDKTTTTANYDSVGDTISYSYLVTNSGNVPLTPTYAVTDNKATVTCPQTPNPLNPGAFITCTATYTVTQADLTAGSVVNTATASAQYNGAPVNSNQDQVTVPALQGPALTLDKSTTTANYDSVGDTISYSYLVTNSGNVPLTPTYAVTDNKATVTCPQTPVPLVPGASITCTATYVVTQADLTAGSVVNIATASAVFNGAPVNSNQDQVTVPALQGPALTLDKSTTTANYDSVGDTISYSYLVTNSGNVPLTPTYAVTDNKATVTCPQTPVPLVPGASITCTATYVVTQADLTAGSVVNIATASAVFNGAPVNSNQDQVTVPALQGPALTLDKSTTTANYDSVGDTISYSYLVTNSGNVPLTPTYAVTDNKATVTCPQTPVPLVPGASITCTATYVVTQADLTAGSVVNTATASAVFNGAPVNSNQDQVTVPALQGPALTLDKSTTTANYDSVGDTISYSYLVTNSGNVPLTPTYAVTDNKATVTCPQTPVPLVPGASITCTATYVVTQADLTAGSVVNTATASAVFNGAPVNSNQDQVTVPALQGPALSLDKTTTTVNYDSVGDVISYSYKLTNSGNVPLTPTYAVTDNKATVTCPQTPVPLVPGASITCTATYVVTQADLTAGSVVNTATASAQYNGNPVNSNQDQVTVTALKTASIGNYVWLDENGDGVQDAGEAGIPNVTVQLLNSLGNPVASTVTDANGGYLFTNVALGTYTVVVTPPTGLNPTYNEDTGTTSPDSQTTVIITTQGEEHLTADFGYNWVPPTDTTNPPSGATGAIGDRVWNDANGNGKQDPGESGIKGVTVRLLQDTNGDGAYGGLGDAAAVTTTTDAAGNYIFDGLPQGAYVVEVDTTTLPAGITWIQTGDPDGTTGMLDNRTTTPIILAPGDVYVNADFGYQPQSSSSIGDRIYLDANGDGTDGGLGVEPGIPGVTVALKDINGNYIATTITDQNGLYLFPGLPAGTYTVVVTDTDHVLGEVVQTGDPDTVKDGQSTVAVDGVNNNLNQDFGYAPPEQQPGKGLIGDTIFLDRNGNSLFDAGEGLEGVKVNLYDSTGATLLASTVTNENGQYAFGGLNPTSTYQVRVDTTTLPNGGVGLTNTVDPDGGTPSQSTVALTSASPINLNQDFGYRPTILNTIGGTIWIDSNADGTLGAGEPGRVLGVTVELRDANGNVVGTTFTDANGNYSFSGLPDGTYKVHVTDTANVLNGYWKSDGPNDGQDNNSQVDPYTVAVSGGQTNTTGDFGYWIDGAALGNRVWNDANSDGIQQTTETTGLGGVLLKLVITYPNGAVTTVYTVSNSVNGGYSFGNLLLDENFNGVAPPSQPTYSISVVTPPSGYNPSPIGQGGNAKTDSNNPAGTTATVVRGQTVTTVLSSNPNGEPANASYDFGYNQGPNCTVTCDVYPQPNGDGKVDINDITWIFNHKRQKVTPPGAPHSGDCVADGILTVNDATACQAYLTP